MAVALGLNAPIAELLSVRSAAALAVFVLAALVMTYTHIGRDVIATGSDRRASRIAGLNTDRVIIGVFAASGASRRARRRAAELQPRRGIAGGARRRAGARRRRRDRRRRIGRGRSRQPDGDRGGRAYAVHPAFGTERDRRRAARARPRHRRHPRRSSPFSMRPISARRITAWRLDRAERRSRRLRGPDDVATALLL